MTLVNDLTFQLGNTGVVLNDDTVFGVPFVDITKVSGLDSAPFRETKRDHEGIDGGFMDAEFESGRDVVLEGTLYVPSGTNIESYLDSLKANFAPSRTLVPFYYLTQGLTRVVYVKPLGVSYSWDELRRIGASAVRFSMFAEKPMIFDVNTISVVLSVGATIFTGFSFPLSFSFGFGGVSTTSDGQFITNAGNRPTPPLLTITGPVTNPVIYNDTTSQNLTFNITLLGGDTLVIDPYYHTVRLNGIANRRSTLINAGWFYLQPGQNFIRFRAQSGSGTLTVAYQSAWR